MAAIPHEKLAQAVALLPEFNLDAWLLLGRETGELCDPSLHLILEGGLTWQSAFLIHRSGERIAIVGRYDAATVERSGGYTRVIGYDEDIAPLLRAELSRLDPQSVGLNYSKDNHTSDGLTLGMYLSLQDWLEGTPYRDRLTSADDFAGALRARKSPGEIARMEQAIARTVELLGQVESRLKLGMAEQELQSFFHAAAERWGVTTAWDRRFCPIVNFGPESVVGHAAPSDIVLAPGHLVHIDFGIRQAGYCADLQRCWYVARTGESEPPEPVLRAFAAVTGAIAAAADFLRPGCIGAEVDNLARSYLTAAGYPEYKHALGHQVGRTCHDGGTLLGPRWPRYGRTIEGRVAEGEVYTLELGVATPAGILSLEEMVVVTATGCRFLTEPQRHLPILAPRA